MNKQPENNSIITILGPTASGKTRIAALLAHKLNGEVISADSRQVYKSMNLGTGKDIDDYKVDGGEIPYHLIDIREAGAKYNLFEYQQDFFRVYNEIKSRNKTPILCGGTGLYIEAATKGYQMKAVPPNEEFRHELEQKSMEELTEILKNYKSLHNTSDIDSKKRAIRAIEIEKFQADHPEKSNFPTLSSLYIGIKFDRPVQRKRITERLKQRLENGMIGEVEYLLNKGVKSEDLIYYGLEYKYLTMFVTGKMSYDEMFEALNTAIHQFAKRQMTWFRKMERNGDKIHWMDGYEPEQDKITRIMQLLNRD